ncbi:MAG TPA: hypothetical protein VFM96_12420 [Gaiellaceae bacterium]|nr:hypothetical protein [Gaiellaceae bacterium]
MWPAPIGSSSFRDSEPLGLGMHGVRPVPDELTTHTSVQFTRRFESGYEGRDWQIALA